MCCCSTHPCWRQSLPRSSLLSRTWKPAPGTLETDLPWVPYFAHRLLPIVAYGLELRGNLCSVNRNNVALLPPFLPCWSRQQTACV